MRKADLPTLGQLPRSVPSSRYSTVYAQTTRKPRSLVIVTSLTFRSPVPVSMSVVSLKVFKQNPSDYLNRSQRDFLLIKYKCDGIPNHMPYFSVNFTRI